MHDECSNLLEQFEKIKEELRVKDINEKKLKQKL